MHGTALRRRTAAVLIDAESHVRDQTVVIRADDVDTFEGRRLCALRQDVIDPDDGRIALVGRVRRQNAGTQLVRRIHIPAASQIAELAVRVGGVEVAAHDHVVVCRSRIHVLA
jgi:hypothetical protein